MQKEFEEDFKKDAFYTARSDHLQKLPIYEFGKIHNILSEHLTDILSCHDRVKAFSAKLNLLIYRSRRGFFTILRAKKKGINDLMYELNKYDVASIIAFMHICHTILREHGAAFPPNINPAYQKLNQLR